MEAEKLLKYMLNFFQNIDKQTKKDVKILREAIRLIKKKG